MGTLTIQPSDIKEGDILIGHGLLMTPALLLEKKLKIDEGRLLDFCTFLNGLILQDRLITLPADIPNELEESGLYRYLRDNHLLLELNFDYSDFGEEEKEEMQDLFGQNFSRDDANEVLGQLNNSIYNEYTLAAKPRYDERYVGDFPEGYNEYHINTTYQENQINLQRSKFIDEIINSNPKDWERKIPDNSVLLNENSNDLQLHRLRTVAYWEISGMLKIAYLPDFMRIPMISGYQRGIRQSIRYLIQNSVDSLFIDELKGTLNFAESNTIAVPILLPVFLNEFNIKGSMEDTFNGLRDRFNDSKKKIVEWEKKMQKEKKYSEAIAIKREINESLAALKPSDIKDLILTLSPGIAADIASSNVGSSTAISPAMAVVKEVLRWRRRSRITFSNTGRQTALELENMSDLLKSTFGRILTPGQRYRFVKLSESLYNLAI